MQHLRKGIQVCYRDREKENTDDGIWLSTGTMPVSSTVQRYRQNAFLPQPSWHSPSITESEFLLTRSVPENPGASISIFRIPDTAFSRFNALGLASASTRDTVERLFNHKEYRLAMAQILSYLSPFFFSQEKITVNPLTTNPPGLPTVTFDYQNDCYIGLHLDSWDHLPLQQREQSTTRICINMGMEDRFFLFINLTLKDIFELLHSDMSIDHFQRHHNEGSLVTTFMSHYPSYPVVKLRIAPGEAYLAPTENMIHDASTLGKKSIDVIMTIRGYMRMNLSSVQ